MSKNSRQGLIAILVIVAIILIDQVTKILVKTNMSLRETIEITGWFKIYFIENPGMAFGMEVGSKLFLTLFRIIAVCFIGYYLYYLVKNKYSRGYVICIALIWAGAFGNIIDCVFYGEIFSESTPSVLNAYGEAMIPGKVASFVPVGEGYETWFHGRVVDMLYFPLIEGRFPSWFPVWANESFVFFSPVFNIADSAITVGIFVLILFYRKTLNKSLEKKKART